MGGLFADARVPLIKKEEKGNGFRATREKHREIMFDSRRTCELCKAAFILYVQTRHLSKILFITLLAHSIVRLKNVDSTGQSLFHLRCYFVTKNMQR